MQSKANSTEQYLKELPTDRQEAMSKLRKAIMKNLPKGFKEEMNYGMIGYVVPHELDPSGYHCDPKQPLPFMNIASQKNFIAVYHMGVYADKNLLDWFVKEYAKATTGKLDMGKSSFRFKKPELIPLKLIGELAGKISVDEWINKYEENVKKIKAFCMPYNEKLADRVREIIALNQQKVEEKKMFGGLCFMVNDKMCVGVESGRMMVRLDPAKYEEVMEKNGVTPMDFTGKSMNGFVFVDLAELNTKKKLGYWLNLALEYNKIAKASKKKKK